MSTRRKGSRESGAGSRQAAVGISERTTGSGQGTAATRSREEATATGSQERAVAAETAEGVTAARDVLQDAELIAKGIEHVWSRMCHVERGQEYEQAWNRLYAECVKVLAAIVRRMGVHPQDCDDMVETILVETLIGLPRFLCGAGKMGFRAWLSRLAHDKVVDYWRRADCRPAHTALPDDYGDDDAAASLHDEPSRVLCQQCDADVLQRSLEMLQAQVPADHFEQFRRHFVDGERLAAIATSQGAKFPTVQGHVYRTRDKLRAIAARLDGAAVAKTGRHTRANC